MKFKIQNSKFKIKEIGFDVNDLIKVLLKNRGLKTKKEIDEFLNPKLENITTKNVGIDSKQLQKAISRIQKAIKNKEQIVVFGDYDVDGICGTAILWETLNSLGAKVVPYIPHRIEEGYGLSIKGIQNANGIPRFTPVKQASSFTSFSPLARNDRLKLIITVDNGIVANEAVNFANENGIDVIITDHHVPSKKLPDAFAIVHTVKLCGAGVAYLLAQEIRRVIPNSFRDLGSSGTKMLKQVQHDKEKENHLELVALATIADLVPLIGANRTLTKYGLEQLRQTKRVGLLELFKEAVLDPLTIDVYQVGHIIAPRLNAMGRLEYAMDSLRLLCTNNRVRAKMLAQILGDTNRQRQELTLETVEHAKSIVYSSSDPAKPESREVIAEDSSRQARTIMQKLLFIAHESYQQGVIGLVAGKLVEEFYRPAIVVSIGEKYSKASARSVNGFNIIEFIRSASELLIDAGGHPMAAGFTVETVKLAKLEEQLTKKSEELLDEELLTRTLKIDCELPLYLVNEKLYSAIQNLSPFGMGNPEPTFVSRKVLIEDLRLVGRDGKHIKLKVKSLDGIAFGMGERYSEFKIGDEVDIVYTIDEDKWNGNRRLQLKVKDIK